MNMIGSNGGDGAAGLNAFLQGLDNQTFSYGDSSTGSPGLVTLSNKASGSCNYYGIYPSQTQTSTRALATSILNSYHLNVTTYAFNTVGNWNPGAIYRHSVTTNQITQYQGGFFALGLTRTADIRLTALGLLTDFHPSLYPSEYTASGNSRIVVLQLGIAGGA
jgi:hypothetical protein